MNDGSADDLELAWLRDRLAVPQEGVDPAWRLFRIVAVSRLLARLDAAEAQRTRLADYMNATDAVSPGCAAGTESFVECAVAGWDAVARIAAVYLPARVKAVEAELDAVREALRACVALLEGAGSAAPWRTLGPDSLAAVLGAAREALRREGVC